jgi:hypothetical protein
MRILLHCYYADVPESAEPRVTTSYLRERQQVHAAGQVHEHRDRRAKTRDVYQSRLCR